VSGGGETIFTDYLAPSVGAPPAIAERIPLGDEIARYIRELIITGRLQSGQQVNIEALARDLEISPTPVREALQVLKGEGFVRAEPHRGFRIATLTTQDIHDMFLVQAHVAGELATRAASHATSELLAEITGLQTDLREADARSDGEEMERLNYQFHRVINRAAGAPKLTWLMGVVVRYAPRVFYPAIPGWNDASLRDHDAIIEAIRNGDQDSARETMTAHIRHAGVLLVTYLESGGFGQGAG
jgi:DNA-binding GntR family transcriptional regulator